jgi:hypothetical protein
VRRHFDVAVPPAGLFAAVNRVVEDRRFRGVEGGFELAEVDVLALAGAAAVVERRD